MHVFCTELVFKLKDFEIKKNMYEKISISHAKMNFYMYEKYKKNILSTTHLQLNCLMPAYLSYSLRTGSRDLSGQKKSLLRNVYLNVSLYWYASDVLIMHLALINYKFLKVILF